VIVGASVDLNLFFYNLAPSFLAFFVEMNCFYNLANQLVEFKIIKAAGISFHLPIALED